MRRFLFLKRVIKKCPHLRFLLTIITTTTTRKIKINGQLTREYQYFIVSVDNDYHVRKNPRISENWQLSILGFLIVLGHLKLAFFSVEFSSHLAMHDVPAKIVDEDKSPQESVTNEIIAWKWNFTIPRLVAQQERTIHLYLDLFFNKRFGSKEWWIGFCEFGLSSKPELWSLPDTTDMLVQTSKSATHVITTFFRSFTSI